jgi:hypothetical protein
MYQFALGFSAGAAVAAFLIKGGSSIHGELTPPRKQLFGHLLANVHGPDKLRKMSQLFGAEGLKAHADILDGKAKQVDAQAKIAAEWVDRARSADQNAIGSIAEVRRQAAQGSRRAKVSCFLIERYIACHPIAEHPEMSISEEATAAIEGSFSPGIEPPPEEQPNETPH